MGKNYYQVLGISEKASQEDIRKAYRRLVIRFHPDRNGGNKQFGAIVNEIYEAYRILSVPSERKKYDEYLSQSRNPYIGVESQPNTEPTNNDNSYDWIFSRYSLMIFWFCFLVIYKANKLESLNTWSPPTLQYVTNMASTDQRSAGDRFFGNLDSSTVRKDITSQ